jgi:4-hydroxybenzoate polyprenyltransferase
MSVVPEQLRQPLRRPSRHADPANRPFPWRLAAWGRERFPPGLLAVLFPAYLVALLYGRALTRPAAPTHPAAHPAALWLSPGDVVAFLGVWAFFLMVRIVDDHKDYERDCTEHPRRMLQRGAVTLDQLKVVAAVALLVQFAVVVADRPARDVIGDDVSGFGLHLDSLGWIGFWWALTLGWAALAAKDFFLGERITDRPVLYPLLHVPLSALVCLWMAQFGAGARSLPAAAFTVAALGIVLSASVDLVRKLLQQEGGGRAYAVALGARRAGLAGVAAVVAQTAVLVTLVRAASGWPAASVILPALAVGALLALIRFAVVPAPARARLARAAMALLLPAQLAVSAAALLIGSGGR